MNKPPGMSRKDCLNMKSIVRDFLGDPDAIVEFDDEGGADGFKSSAHDEGFSSRNVLVNVVEDKPGTYHVLVLDSGRDCDGRTSSDTEYIVVKSSHRKRWYNDRNWDTNRPKGKFGVRSEWRSKRITGRQRDYTAESMGY